MSSVPSRVSTAHAPLQCEVHEAHYQVVPCSPGEEGCGRKTTTVCTWLQRVTKGASSPDWSNSICWAAGIWGATRMSGLHYQDLVR